MTRVMILEGEPALRAALQELLEVDQDLEVVGVPGTVEEAVEVARRHQPDVALVSTELPDGGAVGAVREIAAVSPGTRVLALSAYDDRSHVVEMLRAGVIGYVLKGMPPHELTEAIVRAARGQASFPQDLITGFFASAFLERPSEIPPALVENAPDGIVLADAQGRIVLVNGQVERLFGYGRAELVGAPVELLVPERLRDRHVPYRNEYLAHPSPRSMGVGLELMGRRKDGTDFPVDVSLSGIETDDGRLVAAFIRDDTMRLERLERERDLAARRAVLARVVAAGEEERRQIAADIHDDSIQVMTAAGMRLQILRRSIEEPEQLRRLDELEKTVQLSIARLRHLIFELRPPALDLHGLGAALRAYVDDLKLETGMGYEIEDLLTDEPLPPTRVILYRIAQEVLTNVRKHAAASAVTIALSNRDGGYHVRIADDGVGFVPDLTTRRPGHLGLAAIRERAELAGGSLQVESRPGAGTIVEYWVAPDIAQDV